MVTDETLLAGTMWYDPSSFLWMFSLLLKELIFDFYLPKPLLVAYVIMLLTECTPHNQQRFSYCSVTEIQTQALILDIALLSSTLTHIRRMDLSILIIWMSPFRIYGCLVYFIIFILFLIENPLSKQSRPWSDAASDLGLYCLPRSQKRDRANMG